METFVMLTRLSPQAVSEPKFIEKIEKKVVEKIRKAVPEVKWIASYAVLGPYDYVDIFEAPDGEAATKVSLLVRSLGHATTETWVATKWERFVRLAREAA